jgi:CRP/FNR family transcriptional regulator, cyclic AMP receptor protein
MHRSQNGHQGIQPEHNKNIAQNRWFKSLSKELRADLLAHVTERILKPGEYMFRRGDHISATGCGFCVSVAGRLKASSVTAYGNEFILILLEPGNWFGELSLVLDRPHTHDVIAVEPCTVFSVQHNQLERLLLNRDLRDALLRLTAVRLHQAMVMWEDRCTLPPGVLVARRLYMEARGGLDELDTPNKRVLVSQEMLASMLGFTRQTLHKELRLLVEEKIIMRHYKTIEVLDFKRLAKLAQL